MTDFIYTLTNRLTGSIYVGKTHNPPARHYNHIYMLKKGISHHPKLQIDFNIHGDVYDFQVVDKQLKSDHIDREALWINKIDHRLRLNIQKCYGNAQRANDRLKAIRANLEGVNDE
jgi:group I intron endonuclease